MVRIAYMTNHVVSDNLFVRDFATIRDAYRVGEGNSTIRAECENQVCMVCMYGTLALNAHFTKKETARALWQHNIAPSPAASPYVLLIMMRKNNVSNMPIHCCQLRGRPTYSGPLRTCDERKSIPTVYYCSIIFSHTSIGLLIFILFVLSYYFSSTSKRYELPGYFCLYSIHSNESGIALSPS